MAFCSGANRAIKNALTGFTPEIEEKLNQAIEITGKIKDALASSTAIAATDVIPGEWDETLRAGAVKALDKSLIELDIVKGCIGIESTEGKLQCILDELAKLTGYSQNSWLVKLLSRLIANMDDNDKKEHFYDTVAQIGAVSR